MKKLHQKAMDSSTMYREWHGHELTELLSWAIFFAMSFMAYNVVSYEANRTLAIEQGSTPVMYIGSQ